ncbi:hypothetical protein [Oecophyllibacter saccharovorans]|uniref:Uncharacterized protein n=1 Tax=Oecophyllibacter saccharovorans TaxID=2558360 RepID=A0A506URB3_9PROT|nr:hypothetical protein [Oecophyllibacter saccharovorans]QDH14746.1 hypothetical protein E3E11_01475 [Oecophyllibacter saccharovorans]TPW34945.1 hypothetical protein E3203_05455 [Oecophyllibacter saccharovorans]TPW35884.1 hypothetical protein E3202_02895 [Oecophyllibacter saccharovorans]
MITAFAFALVMILLTFGQDARWLPLYGIACAVACGLVQNGFLAAFSVGVLIVFNFGAWLALRSYGEPPGPLQGQLRGLLPIVLTLLLELVLALAGASVGLAALLAVALVVGALCLVGTGTPLTQFCGLLMAADGLMVLGCVLSSWGLCLTAVALWAVLALLGRLLLPRLVWRRSEAY